MPDKWNEENEKWYYYVDGKKVSGWIEENDRWFHLNDRDNSLDTGWFQTEEDNDLWFYGYVETTVINEKQVYLGEMATGWLEVDGETYYLIEESDPSKAEYKGACVISCTRVIQGMEYSFDEKGRLIKNAHNISKELFEMIKSFEGCYLDAYFCPSHVLTIGIGNTSDKWTSLKHLTMEQAYEAFGEDMESFRNGIENLESKYNISLKSNEIEALISFAFNCGLSALENSTLWKDIINNVKDYKVILNDFLMWTKDSNHKTLEGLVKRRRAEADLFTYGKYSVN